MSALDTTLASLALQTARLQQGRDEAIAIAQWALLAGDDPEAALIRISLLDHEETP